MAINKITAPLSTGPSVFADPVINQLAALLDTYNDHAIIQDGYIMAGSLFCIGGAMYLADSNTSISGTSSNYVAITAIGSTATAAYVSALSSVTYNSSYHNYYDTSGVLYLFDESDAINDGYISTRYYIPTPTRTPNKLTVGTIAFSTIQVLGTSAYNASYTLRNQLVSPRAGKIRTSFTLYNGGSGTGYGRIYVNGTATGTEHTVSSASTSTFTDDISVSAGDLIQLYVYSTSSSSIAVNAFILESGIIL